MADQGSRRDILIVMGLFGRSLGRRFATPQLPAQPERMQ